MHFPLLLLFLLLTTTTTTTTTSTSTLLKLPIFPFPSPHPSLLHSPHPHPHLPLLSGAPLGSGQYLVHLSLGSPPQPLRLIADTGSDLIFTRCTRTRTHSHSAPSFHPLLSSSFHPLHCFSPSCHLLPHLHRPTCNHSLLHSPCRYSYSYSDLSSSSGFFSYDKITTPAAVFANQLLHFGCAFSVSSPSSTHTFTAVHGVMGLGKGPISFPSQLATKFGNVFSYCLSDYTISPPPTSYLTIGIGTQAGALLNSTRSRLTFTPFVSNPLSPTFYYVHILGVSVNGKMLPIPPSVWDIDSVTGNGGVIVDSGTTLSFLPKPACKEIVRAMRRAIPRSALLVRGPPGFDLCVNSRLKMALPRLRWHLKGGGKMSPPTRNYMVEVEEGVRCLGIQAVVSGGGFGVIGNLMQQGFEMVFDRRDSRLGFKFTDCAAG